MTACRQRSGTIEHADVVESQKAALKNVHPLCVFAIHPPGEIKQQLVESALEEVTIGHAANAFFDLINAPRGPGMHRRIHIAESPLVRRQLSVRMHIPLAQKKCELLLSEIRIDLRERNAMER